MAVREYIGARYIPLFADPIDWDNTLEYEPLTVVLDQGASYVSRQWVPVGIDILNTDYWILWADYNAQIAAYRAEVQTFDGRITQNSTDIGTLQGLLPSTAFDSENTVEDAIDAVSDLLPAASFSALSTVDDAITAVSNAAATANEEFDTFSALTGAADLVGGYLYSTRGYAAIGDGGAGLYAATDTSSTLTFSTSTTGIYLLYIPVGKVNGAAVGCIGSTASTDYDMALAYSEAAKLPIEFPAEITTSAVFTVGNYPVEFCSNLEYTGTSYAVQIEDPAFSEHPEIRFRKISAANGSGIRLYQNQSTHTITNPIVEGSRIEAANYGITLQADTWGILEGFIKVGRIRSGADGIKMVCNQLDPNKTSFIGEMHFEIGHIHCDTGYAVRMDAPDNATITGVFFGATSFENSANGIGIYATGDIHSIIFENLRVFEVASFTNIIYATGKVRDLIVNCASPIRVDKISITTSVAFSSSNIYIRGGIISPSSYRFADEMFVSSRGRTFRYGFYTGQSQSSAFTFGSTSTQWRIFREFKNNSSNNVEIRNLEYFTPWGVPEIILNQNKTNGATYTLYDLDGNVIFDGTSVADSGRTSYKIRALWDAGNSAIKYAIDKVATAL